MQSPRPPSTTSGTARTRDSMPASLELAWGVEACVDFWEGGSSSTQTAKFDPSPAPAGSPPTGTYSFSGRQSPDFLGMFTARIGYAGNQWLPYLKGGALLAGGSQNSELSYVPEGATTATASFDGGKSFATIGWVAAGGAEFGLYGPWRFQRNISTRVSARDRIQRPIARVPRRIARRSRTPRCKTAMGASRRI
jgi:hypothetical protein